MFFLRLHSPIKIFFLLVFFLLFLHVLQGSSEPLQIFFAVIHGFKGFRSQIDNFAISAPVHLLDHLNVNIIVVFFEESCEFLCIEWATAVKVELLEYGVYLFLLLQLLPVHLVLRPDWLVCPALEELAQSILLEVARRTRPVIGLLFGYLRVGVLFLFLHLAIAFPRIFLRCPRRVLTLQIFARSLWRWFKIVIGIEHLLVELLAVISVRRSLRRLRGVWAGRAWGTVVQRVGHLF